MVELTQTEVVYVSKAGSDIYDGLNINRPKLTIGAAITAAAALVTGGSNGVQVCVLDAENYDEDLTLTSDVHLFAPTATLIGAMSLNDDTSAFVGRHYTEANSEVLVTKLGNTSSSYYRALLCDLRGIRGPALTGCQGFRNNTNGGILFVNADSLFVDENGVGVMDGGAALAGHIHFHVRDLYLSGNGAIGIAATASASHFIGFIDHILELGTPSPSSTVGISVGNAGARVELTANEINVDTAYAITSGSLYLTCPKVTGARTGTPVVELSDATAIASMKLSTTIELTETTAPSAPAANKVLLYAVDNGAGKTQLMAIFPTGVAQQLAIEP